ncbi:hypothetical protein M595_3628 [Lyngbya aestuarii BL J]|uniref:Uncharacterized protein n=1 Tax=Lyngbya aestuarii BL J TaxID=1348334 RepID=U7QEP5_9CYAN|nr:hypothetical protein M595_3628 [Lyngbya aestuarii BL J]
MSFLFSLSLQQKTRIKSLLSYTNEQLSVEMDSVVRGH